MRVSERDNYFFYYFFCVFEEGEVWESFPEEMMTDLGFEG